jgi:hypothetical protein
MDIYYSNLHNKIQANKPSRFEHIAAAIFKIFLLASVSTIFFKNDNFAFGSLFAVLAYGYTFYGLFIKQPQKVEPYPYVGGTAWKVAETARVKREKQQSRTKNRNCNPHLACNTYSSSQTSNFNNNDHNFSQSNNYSQIDDIGVNPANGYPTMGAIDVAGNPYGFDNSDVGAATSFDNDDFRGESFAGDDHINSFSDEF